MNKVSKPIRNNQPSILDAPSINGYMRNINMQCKRTLFEVLITSEQNYHLRMALNLVTLIN